MPATAKTETSTLPADLGALFWDCDFSRLRWPGDRDFITARILTTGPWQAIRWLRGAIGDAEIRRWILGRSGRGLSPPQLRFWELILDLPKAEVDAWLGARSSDPWERRRDP